MTATPFCVLDDVRDFGVTEDDASDARVTRGIGRATSAINKYVGFILGVQESKQIILDGIYKGYIPLPTPFSDITEVLVDTIALDSSLYEVREWGIKLFPTQLIADADGFPIYGSRLGDLYTAIRFKPNVAATVKVTASFGDSDIDPIITEACIILASGFARANADDALFSAQLGSLNAGGIVAQQSRQQGRTTGNLDVDAMLDDFLLGSDLVG